MPSAQYQLPNACEFESCLGCMNENACNYDPEATLPDDNCEFAPLFYDCEGNCINPSEYFYTDGPTGRRSSVRSWWCSVAPTH